MKNKFSKTILLFFLLISTISTSQIINSGNLEAELFLPSQFSWNAVKTKTGVRNFVTSPKDQLSVGPCLAFATTSTVESLYKIVYNDTQTSLDLAETFLDFSFPGQPQLNIATNNFKLPIERILTVNLGKTNRSLPGVLEPTREFYDYRDSCNDCVVLEKEFVIEFGVDNYEFAGCGDFVINNDFVTVSNAVKLSSEEISVKKIKELIISKGPITLKVKNIPIDGVRSLDRIKNYNIDSSSISYHAYSIIGWENDGNNTKWILKDSWQGKQGIIKTSTTLLPDAKFINLSNTIIRGNVTYSPQLSFFRLENVIKNNIPPLPGAKFIVNRKLQEPTPVPLTLSIIHSELHSANIGGVLYSKFYITSNVSVEDWQWRTSQLCLTRNIIKGSNISSIYISPINNGQVTVEVRAKKNNIWSPWRQKTIILSNGNGRN